MPALQGLLRPAPVLRELLRPVLLRPVPVRRELLRPVPALLQLTVPLAVQQWLARLKQPVPEPVWPGWWPLPVPVQPAILPQGTRRAGLPAAAVLMGVLLSSSSSPVVTTDSVRYEFVLSASCYESVEKLALTHVNRRVFRVTCRNRENQSGRG